MVRSGWCITTLLYTPFPLVLFKVLTEADRKAYTQPCPCLQENATDTMSDKQHQIM